MKKLIFVLILLLSSLTYAQDLEKKISYDLTITEDGTIQARKITRITEDSEELSKSYYRFNGAIPPGGNVPEELPQSYKDAIEKVWTPEVIKAYQDKIELERLELERSEAEQPEEIVMGK